MRNLRRLLRAALLCAALAPLSAAPAVYAPSGLRQGDPFLLWLADDCSVASGRAELWSPSGGLVDSATLFEAGDALRDGLLFQPGGAGPGGLPAGAPVPAEPPLPGHLYGALFALDMVAEAGTYRVVITGFELGTDPSPPRMEGSVPSALPAGRAPVPGAGPATVAAAPGLAFSLEYRFQVARRDFSSEDIPLDPANTAIRTVPDPRKDAEAKALYALLGQVDEGAAWLDEGFLFPVDSQRRTAGFGDRRRYVYAKGGSDTSVHAGIDVGVPQATPVRACGAGRVVFAAERIVTGKTIIIEHLPGLYSLYMHLSSIKVVPGELVPRGGPIGLSGSTGLSTGPHLHWELRLRGRAVDPDYWVLSPLLDKGLPISKM